MRGVCVGLGKLIDGCAPTQQSEGVGAEERGEIKWYY